jgi:hypothetical protein
MIFYQIPFYQSPVLPKSGLLKNGILPNSALPKSVPPISLADSCLWNIPGSTHVFGWDVAQVVPESE